MPVRLRITLLFSVLVFIILGLVCSGVFYFSYTSRVNTISKRLKNRAITTGRLLSQQELFDRQLVLQIDSLTTITLKNKMVQAYDHHDHKIYSYSDVPGDTLSITKTVLDNARVRGQVYFTAGNKEAVAYHYTDANSRFVVVSAGEDEEGRAHLEVLRNMLLLGFLIGNLLVWISGSVFSKRLLQPIKKITGDVAEISAHNLTRRLQVGDTHDEWHQLTTTLNELLNRLQESFEMQRRFISNASHELSTPLTSISSQLEVALQRHREAADYREVLVSVHQDVRYMSKLTQTLLEFAKASGSAGGLDLQQVRMDEVLLRLPAEVAKIGEGYTVVLKFEELPEGEESLLVYGNETLLFTAIKNLVINACKYSGNHLAVVQLQVKEEEIFVLIKDEGVGIPEKDLEKIFQPFYRVEENLQGGFGLGLSLTRRIINLHKGTIEVTSQIGKGTTFTVRLPVALR